MRLEKLDDLTLGHAKALVTKAGGLEAACRILSDEVRMVVLEKDQEIPKPALITTNFPSFTTFDLGAFLESWAKFYADVFGVALNLGEIALPPLEQALGAGVVMHSNITIERILAEIRNRTLGRVLYRYTKSDLDGYVQQDKEAWRPARGVYAVWMYPAVEATDQAPELAEKSYKEIGQLGIAVANFREYAMLFLWHLALTGKPLDRQAITLSGSLVADGHVLGGGWHGDRFSVYWYDRHDSCSSLRARQVVLPLA